LQDSVRDWFAGVDAVTVVSEAPQAPLQFYNEWENLVNLANMREERVRPWYLHGYKGKQVGSFRVGLQDARAILSVTGPMSDRVFGVSRHIACKYTRIDLQVTVDLEDRSPMVAASIYHSPNLLSQRERGKLWMSYHSSPEGDTVYINRRTSPSYARIYDKSHDFLKPQGTSWRFEVELKEALCDKLGRILENLSEYEGIAADYVVGWFGDRGLCVPLGVRDKVSIPRESDSVSGNDQTLGWLAKQVRPSLIHLKRAGLHREAQNALGVQLIFPDDITAEEI